MEIRTEIDAGLAIIKLSGSAESGTIDEFTATIHRLLDDGHREFVVNLELVKYIDSVALDAIVRAYTEVSRRGGRLKVQGLSQRFRDILDRSNLTRFLEPGVDPFPNPVNPRLGDGYRYAAIVTGSLILLMVLVATILWRRH